MHLALLALPLFCGACNGDLPASPSGESVDTTQQALLDDGGPPLEAAQRATEHLAVVRARMERPAPSTLQAGYTRCSATASARKDCLEPLSNLLYALFTRHVVPYLGEHKEELSSLVVDPAYRMKLERTYVETDDDRTRIVALALLRAASTEGYRALPAAAYEDMENKTEPELALLLELHAGELSDSGGNFDYLVGQNGDECCIRDIGGWNIMDGGADNNECDTVSAAHCEDDSYCASLASCQPKEFCCW